MPTLVATGLIALDEILDEEGRKVGSWAGGTCGNVAALLGRLGWRSWPIGRLDASGPSNKVRRDLRSRGASTEFLGLRPAAAVPVYVQRLVTQPDGSVNHRFDRRCPECGGWLPSYRPVTAAAIARVLRKLAEPDVVFFDRVSRGALDLAEWGRGHGALIVFEPSAAADERHLQEALELADIVKYSEERVPAGLRPLIETSPVALEIETLGADGLRYRRQHQAWRRLKAPSCERVADAAGAGDWTTAGLLYQIGGRRHAAVELSDEALEEALQVAQAYGAWSCQFVGAQGGMVGRSGTELMRAIKRLHRGSAAGDDAVVGRSHRRGRGFACAQCV
jgi:sugar/nucleoside kinase (ribokinase family)